MQLRCEMRCRILCLITLAQALALRGTEDTSWVDQQRPPKPEFLSFSDESFPAAEFQHMVIDKKSLYIGGTNALYQLDARTLQQRFRIATGPKLDSPYCNEKGDCMQQAGILRPSRSGLQSDESRTSRGTDAAQNGSVTTPKLQLDNVNKILLVYKAKNLLISCGSLFQGSCSLYRLGNISQSISVGPVPVAANSANGSTVAFLSTPSNAAANSGSNTPLADDAVLYVGASFTYDAYRDTFPAVATRSLKEASMFRLAFPGDVSGQSGMIIQNEHRTDFRITYVGGFTSEGFAYWATIQKSGTEHNAPYISKLARVCVGDDRYETYSEIPLECMGTDNSKYNLLQAVYVGRVGPQLMRTMPQYSGAAEHQDHLIAVFAKGTNPAKLLAQSAVCVYSMKDVRASFQINIERCNNDIGYLNLPQFGYRSRCFKVYDSISEDFCGQARVGGDLALTQLAFATYDSTLLTSVTASIVREHTVVFLGTREGNLKKLLVTSKVQSKEYNEVPLFPGQPIGSDMFFDAAKEHIYVIAKNKVFKLRTENCGAYLDCDSCLQAHDPHCGWCLLENRCTASAQCNAGQNSVDGQWQSFGSGQCPKIVDLSPNNSSTFAPVSTLITIQFNFMPVPQNNEYYQCVFDNNHVAASFKAPSTLQCNLPVTASRPKILADNSDHVSIPLKIWSSASRMVFFETRFVFYDCTRHSLCTSCVESKWGCDWCLLENACVYDGFVCKNQVMRIHSRRQMLHESNAFYQTVGLRTGVPVPVASCPQISPSEAADLLLPSEQPSTIVLPVENLDKILINDVMAELVCLLEVKDEAKTFRSGGRLKADSRTVECDSTIYSYEAQKAEVVADFQIQLKGGQIIDRVPVKLYKCDLMADDCSQCFMLDTRYKCAWCVGRCQYQETCPAGTLGLGVETAKTVCPSPIVESVQPLFGPLEGGTKVVIRGHDLGTRRSEVEDQVFIAGVPCRVVGYEVSTRIDCITERVEEAKTGRVTVTVGGTKKTLFDREFRFVDPRIYSFEPSIGPKSGGTKIRINGAYLNSASVTKVFLGDLRCKIDKMSITDRSLVCITPPSEGSNLSMGGLTVVLDNANRSLEKSFTYAEDPTIDSIEPLESFASGGRQLTVKGNFFDVIQVPTMFLLSSYTGEALSDSVICRVVNRTRMLCPMPALSSKVAQSLRLQRRSNLDSSSSSLEQEVEGERYLALTRPNEPRSYVPEMENEKPDLSKYESIGIGFDMDDVLPVRNVSDRFRVTLTPDPEYYQFDGGRKMHRGDVLILEGKNLNLACKPSDVQVFVGQEKCQITLLAGTQLVCSPPARRPSSYMSNNVRSVSGEPPVTVHVGNLRFDIGVLIYDAPGPVAPALVGGIIAAAAGILLLGVVLVAVWWRRKSFQAEKEYKRIQLQMDSLESNVRNECKQAFAELQTDISDLQGDLLKKTGIPFHTRRVYASKILFREDHSVMLEWQHCNTNGRSNHIHDALVQFECLLRNRQFVLVLVDTLERQPTFSSQDKVYVASLLTAAFARNMQYCTEVVMQLLSNLIAKSVESKCPQLMLRRTESVVEKMLANWIALCLYDYLHDYAGDSLFVLFKALKHQVEKGPVDGVTGDARYSLSEDRLLKEQIHPDTVNVHIIPPSESEPDEKLFCRVLTCDTVTQTKAKMLDALYKHTPHSSRPSVHDVDLEWRHSPTGHVILQDDDRTSPQCKDGWRRLNTLEHYGVSGQAIMALIPRSRNLFSSPNCSNNTYATISIASSTLLLRHSPENVEHGVRYWHLVKPENHCIGRTSTSVIPEIYLTRLLATKGTVQKFIDDFFRTALSISGQHLPPVIKYLFDFLENKAASHGVIDPSVVYAWKNNSLPLRFWVNIIKNPDFIFDVEKSSTVDSCLSVIAQTFMDSCSTADHRLGKDSPSNKLLFAKDLPRYRQLVTDFYGHIRQLPQISDQDINSHLAQLSKAYAQEFNVYGAARELMTYAVKYSGEVMEALEDDLVAQRQGLASKFSTIFSVSASQRAAHC